MYRHMSKETFLDALEDYTVRVGGCKPSSARAYRGKIRGLLERNYSVGDLCGSVDQLLEDYSRGGCEYDPADHGKTRCALRYARRMLKGALLDSLQVVYEEGGGVFRRIDPQVVRYEIRDEKITVWQDHGGKGVTRPVGPVDMGTLIRLLQEGEARGYLGGFITHFSAEPLLLDAPIPPTYTYSIGSRKDSCRGKLFGSGDEPAREALQRQYDDLIGRLVAPYKL